MAHQLRSDRDALHRRNEVAVRLADFHEAGVLSSHHARCIQEQLVEMCLHLGELGDDIAIVFEGIDDKGRKRRARGQEITATSGQACARGLYRLRLRGRRYDSPR